MAPHTGSATPEQIDALLDFLNEHRDLARGRLRSVEGRQKAKRLWEELCTTVNSMGGCTKIVQQWQKVWFDRKHMAKRAAADSRRSASGTGGGPATAPQLSHWELKVLDIMGEGFGDRQTGARVPAFGESNEPVPTTSRQPSQPPSFPQPLNINLPGENAEPRQENSNQPTQLADPETEPTSGQSSQPTRSRRRRQSASGSDVRSRLFQFEAERAERETVRNNELAGIRVELSSTRAALLQLCGLIREYLDRD